LTVPVSPPSGTALPPKANHGPVVKNRCVPTISGLQREVEDMKSVVKNIADSNQAHREENALLHKWFKVLLPLKEKMMVAVLSLEAEMRGLQDGMELEKMKSDVNRLRVQLGQADVRLAQLEISTSSKEEEEEDDDEDEASDHQQDVHKELNIHLPNFSMFVHLAQLRGHIWPLSPPTASAHSPPTTVTAPSSIASTPHSQPAITSVATEAPASPVDITPIPNTSKAVPAPENLTPPVVV